MNDSRRSAFEVVSALKAEVSKVLVGQDSVVDALAIGLLTGGHVLLEGVPGLAKTLAVKSVAEALGCSFSRIQFTPDLLPSDIAGATVYLPDEKRFETRLGPVSANLVLADEVNRAPAKVQSALLEAMQERQVTIGGKTFPLPSPFLVAATMNPIEHSGTYPLPEAQKDRFMLRVLMEYPDRDEEAQILDSQAVTGGKPQISQAVSLEDINNASAEVDTVHFEPVLKEYVLDIVRATRPGVGGSTNKPEVEALLEAGASPRAGIAIVLAAKAYALIKGRAFVIPADVKYAARLVLPHRLVPSFEADSRKVSTVDIVEQILERISPP